MSKSMDKRIAIQTAKLSPDNLYDVVKTYFEAEYTSENWPFRQNGQPCLLPAKLVEEIMHLILRGQAAEGLVKALEKLEKLSEENDFVDKSDYEIAMNVIPASALFDFRKATDGKP